MSEKNKKSLNLLEKLILKFKKTKTTYWEKELERILEIVSLTEGLFQHCNAKEDFSSILMIREKRND